MSEPLFSILRIDGRGDLVAEMSDTGEGLLCESWATACYLAEREHGGEWYGLRIGEIVRRREELLSLAHLRAVSENATVANRF